MAYLPVTLLSAQPWVYFLYLHVAHLNASNAAGFVRYSKRNAATSVHDIAAFREYSAGGFLLSGRLLFQCRKSLRRAVAHQPFAMITFAPRAILTKYESGSSAGKFNNNL